MAVVDVREVEITGQYGISIDTSDKVTKKEEIYNRHGGRDR